MAGHDLWHVALLGSALFGGAGLVILVLAPLVFDTPPPGLARARPLLFALVGVAAVLMAVEWLVIH